MWLSYKHTCVNGYFLNYYENDRIVFGFTEIGFRFNDLSTFFPGLKLLELKQIHSDIIRFSSQIRPEMEGDGIILEKAGTMAVIKTADCIPLFFWVEHFPIGGIIHVGWQGLLKGIEKKIVELVKERSIPLEKLHFYMGPSIEKCCYEVSFDLYEKFVAKSYRGNIFTSKPSCEKTKYLMDIKKGISLSLQDSGISPYRITHSELCTFCEAQRFPSYRRDRGTCNRIYNFLFFKQLPLLL